MNWKNLKDNMASETDKNKKATSKRDSATAKQATAKKASTKKNAVEKTASKKSDEHLIQNDASEVAAPKEKKSRGKAADVAPLISDSSALKPVIPHSLFSDFDIALFKAGKHFRLYKHFGAHALEVDGVKGIYFAVWAPNARSVSVIGNFNFWNNAEHLLFPRWDSSGIWEGFVPNLNNGELYKYCIETQYGSFLEKADPFAAYAELRPRTSSITWDRAYNWKDHGWMQNRHIHNSLYAPYSVYEVHLASWRRSPDHPGEFLSYDDLSSSLVDYVVEMGFTHVEFMPVMEYPFDGSWGYQLTGYFAPSSRFGDPQGFMRLIDRMHQAGVGVILDWVPAHFPGDAHGLYLFDGTHLYEHEDPRKGFHPDWKSYIFNTGRNEVRSFLISNALFWLDVFHADGLRVDAVASMLYLDYSRSEGEWVPNHLGGRENLENVDFLKELNEVCYQQYPGIQTIAEESTSWTGVSRPVYLGGLGFGMKWMMGWMNDSLRYFERDPLYRQHHQNELTFSLVYAFTENFMLPLSHDEVVHGKKSLVYKMPGDDWQRFANLRLLYLWLFGHPGAKLLFMGSEFAQTSEWKHDLSLDWHLLQYAPHKGMQLLIKELNALYKAEKSLFERAFEGAGFEWIDASDSANSVIAFMRKSNDPDDHIIFVLNLTPVIRENYRIGLPSAGKWKELLNTDHLNFYGSGMLNGSKLAEEFPWQYRNYSALFNLPPLGGFVIKKED
jgi:1,4-alpha-glucan branching enzyme